MRFAALVAIVLSLICGCRVEAQEYPNRPITLIIGLALAALSTFRVRMFAEIAAEKLGQPVIIENKVGGGRESCGPGGEAHESR